MTTNTTIPAALIDALPADIDIAKCEIITYAALRNGHDVEHDYITDIPDDATVVILPGYLADDGNAEVAFPDAASGEEAAQEYVDGGDWGDVNETCWIGVWAWRVGYALDEDGDPIDLRIDRERHTITLEPEEPDCEGDHEHDWRSPYSVLGGLKENPGVWGHGGGVVIKEVCAHCGRYKITDTWAQNRETGEQGLTSVSYEEADEDSRAWVRGRAARGRILALVREHGEAAVNAAIRELRDDEDAHVDDVGDARVSSEWLSRADLANLADDLEDHLG